LAVPVSMLLPWLSPVLIFAAGAAAGAVAATARFFARLPGSGFPWAEGPVGVTAMALCSLLTLLTVWAALHPAGVVELAHAFHRRLVRWLLIWEIRVAPVRPRSAAFRRNRDSKRGRLEACTHPHRKEPPWLLPKMPGPRATHGPRAPRRTPLVGVRRRPPP
jgi:competence protein ComEC